MHKAMMFFYPNYLIQEISAEYAKRGICDNFILSLLSIPILILSKIVYSFDPHFDVNLTISLALCKF